MMIIARFSCHDYSEQAVSLASCVMLTRGVCPLRMGHQYLMRTFPVRLKKVLEKFFSVDEISRLHDMMLNVFLSQGHAVKNLLYQNMIIF